MGLADVAGRLGGDHEGEPGDPAWGMEQALLALEKAIDWEPAIVAADLNANRFRDAARLIATKAIACDRRGRWSETLQEALRILAELEDTGDVMRSAALLQRTPVAAAVTNLLTPRAPRALHMSTLEPEEEPTVFLRFNLEGDPVSWPMALNPGRAYRLGVVAAVEKWPEAAEKLIIQLESDVPSSIIECQTIVIRPGALTAEGYLHTKAEIAPTDSVIFTPTATFVDAARAEHRARVVGQRSLRVATFDPILVGSGLPMVAQRVVDLVAELDAKIPSLPRQDRRNLIHLLESTARYAAIANDRRQLQGTKEAGFQTDLKHWLVDDPRIGLRIQEAPKLGSGTTDLLLERIVDELKVGPDPIDIADADRFVRQPTQYASAGDCPISVLTILDTSPKADPPGIQSNYMRWAYPKLHGTSTPAVRSMVAVIIIPISFPSPSSWSALRAGEVGHGL
jgi:hypothetical protein